MSVQQVAKIAAVSPSTVSRYLNGSLALKGETKERVDAAIRETGYVHRPRIKRSASQTKRPLVGLIVPELTNPYFAVLAEEIIAAADQQSVSTLVFSAAYLPQNESHYVELSQRLGLSGLLYVGTTVRNDALNRALESGFPAVVVDEPQELSASSHTVFQDDYSGAFQAVSYLVGLGHREIGFVSGSTVMRTAQDRYRAYSDVLRRHGIDPEEQFHGIGSFTEEYGASALAQMMSSDRRPTAVFVASDIIAVGMAVAANSMRVRIPEELSLVGYDDIPAARYLSPPLTTVHSPLPETARAAVDLIIDAMKGPASPPRHVVVPVGMVIRESARAIPQDGSDERDAPKSR